ncbi:MAG TPA: phosphatase PAP2 family protein [Mycobacteriales bacterium]|jgi:membrane-associated phospholipid phosphatase|nr:phosphatase PAP2 family protein [Mycobacteriales bacterium]
MTEATERAEVTERPVAEQRRPRWWLELPLAVAFYFVYAKIRDLHGDATEHSRGIARAHGYSILKVEKWLHIDVEHGIQHYALKSRDFIIGLDVYYGTFHFIFTCAVFVWLLFKGVPDKFRHSRTVLAIGTAMALVVFAVYPTMPPRLMPPGVKTVDTNEVIGGLWSYNHGVIEHISDPYAALPSLHIVWSSWVAYALWSNLPASRRWRWVFWIYPVFTGYAIIATGVHWTLDLVGGAVVFVVALLLTKWLERGLARRRRRQAGAGANSSSDIDSEVLASRDTAV